MRTKQEIEQEFNQNQKTIQQLLARQEQLKGQWELVNEEKPVKKK